MATTHTAIPNVPINVTSVVRELTISFQAVWIIAPTHATMTPILVSHNAKRQ
jgi:hypothetical protein